MNPDELPPHDKAAEQTLLGTLMRQSAQIPEAARIVSPADFYLYAHQLIFEAIADLGDKNKPVDVVSVADWLTKKNKMEDAGGGSYLAELLIMESSVGVEYHAEIVKGHSIKRRICYAAFEILNEARSPAMSGIELLQFAERKILEIAEMGAAGDFVTLQKALTETWDRLDERCKNPGAGGVPTGFVDLDDILCGLRNSELTIIAARPSVGKSQLALMITNHAADAGMPVLFTSLEQTRCELTERILASMARVDSHRIRMGTMDAQDIEKLMDASGELSEVRIFFDDCPGQNMLRIASNARRLKRRHGIKLMVIDYLQLIDPEDRKQPRHEQVGAISRRLKLLARELKIPILALAQLNRESESNGGSRPKLSQLGASDNIGQDADAVLLLHRQHEDDLSAPQCLIDVIVEKNRNGRRGLATLVYQKRFMRFENSAME